MADCLRSAEDFLTDINSPCKYIQRLSNDSELAEINRHDMSEHLTEDVIKQLENISIVENSSYEGGGLKDAESNNASDGHPLTVPTTQSCNHPSVASSLPPTEVERVLDEQLLLLEKQRILYRQQRSRNQPKQSNNPSFEAPVQTGIGKKLWCRMLVWRGMDAHPQC